MSLPAMWKGGQNFLTNDFHNMFLYLFIIVFLGLFVVTECFKKNNPNITWKKANKILVLSALVFRSTPLLNTNYRQKAAEVECTNEHICRRLYIYINVTPLSSSDENKSARLYVNGNNNRWARTSAECFFPYNFSFRCATVIACGCMRLPQTRAADVRSLST